MNESKKLRSSFTLASLIIIIVVAAYGVKLWFPVFSRPKFIKTLSVKGFQAQLGDLIEY